MAITETGAIYKALSFDGESSRTYGVYITGEAVYNAPERDIEMISIPGRNGAYSLDKGRFQNIEVTYPAGIFADNETDFRNAISDFRNFLCSKRGYVRLTDEYNPNEYRMAVYKSGLEVTPAMLKAGEFNIVFDAKPQRWLTDGETEVTISNTWSNTTTETDSVVEIDNSSGVVGIKDMDIAIEAVQSGSGDPSPDNVRPITGWSNAHVYVGAVSGTADKTYTIDLGGTRYGGTLDVTTGTLTVTHDIVDLGTLNWSCIDAGTAHSRFECTLPSQTIGSGGSTVPTNILCSGYEIASFDTIYAHHKDKVIGLWSASVGVPTSVVVAYDSAYTDAAAFKTAMNGVQLVYELATPTTVSLTPHQISLLTGTNYVWADTGDSTIEYGQSPGLITNPTLFDAKPLIKVTGIGTLGVGDCTATITGTANQVLYIDCEAMEIYKIVGGVSTNASSLVSFSTNDFPVLNPGANTISIGTGITDVTITPRWWKI